jgi:DNA-binding HxlR family transcriptional regulator
MKQPITHTDCTARMTALGDTLYVIGGKWKLHIIIALTSGYKRFNELQRAIPGISARVLSHELKEMELNGLVKRTVMDQRPVVVEYELTEYADTLEGIMTALSDWGMKHRDKIIKSL